MTSPIKTIFPVGICMLLLGQNLANADIVSFQSENLRDVVTDTLITPLYETDVVGIRSDQPDATDNSSRTIVGREGGSGVLRGLYGFDLSFLSGATSVDNVRLVLNIKQGGSGGTIAVGLYSYGYDVDESTASWNAPAPGDATPGGTIGILLSSASAPGGSGPVDVTFDDTQAFRDHITAALAGDGIVRFMVKQDTGSNSAFRRFTSDNDSAIEDRPELVVDYTPGVEPPEPDTRPVISAGMDGSDFVVTVRNAEPGTDYQLITGELSTHHTEWTNVGLPQTGTGVDLEFRTPRATHGVSAFFRVATDRGVNPVSDDGINYRIAFESATVVLNKFTFRYGFEYGSKVYPQATYRDTRGLWFGSRDGRITAVELIESSNGMASFRVTQDTNGTIETATATWYERWYGVRLSIVPDADKPYATIGTGMHPADGPWYGLGDYGGGDLWNVGVNMNHPFVNMSEKGDNRFITSFMVSPVHEMASVHMVQGDERAGFRTQERAGIEWYGKNRYVENVYSLRHIYFCFGDMKAIYSGFKDAKIEAGYPDTKPHFTYFEGSGWEAWPSLGYNTNQATVLEQNQLFVDNGYKLTWSVIGSGFWEDGGNTTHFGRFGSKYPDIDGLKAWFRNNDIKLIFGLRTNTVIGQPEDDELADLGFLAYHPITGEDLVFNAAYFPTSGPKHLLDAYNPAAIDWWEEKTLLWGVDGWKEDAMIRDFNTVYHYGFANEPMRALNERGDLVMARNAYVSSPGSVQRLNDTFGEQDRIPKEAIAYGESGAPNVYSDGIGNGSDEADYLVRHTVLSALTATMAFGKRPWDYDPQRSDAMKMASDWHYQYGPYKYSEALRAYETGYPYTLTPLNIAYPKDPNTYSLTDNKMWQWMIGESMMAHPAFANGGWQRDVYLPAGTWMDFATKQVYQGPITLSNRDHPMDRMPVFIGGKGILVRRSLTDETLLTAEIWPVSDETTTYLYHHYESDMESLITLGNTTWDTNHIVVTDLTSGASIPFTVEPGGIIEFRLIPGHDYALSDSGS